MLGWYFMIEQLINPERPYGEPEYSKLGEQINRLKQQLCAQLDQPGMEWLEQLSDAYARQENTVLRDAFADGFWTATELCLEFHLRRSGNR